MAALLTAAGGHDSTPRLPVRGRSTETDGNPFFVSQVLRHLIETNVDRPGGRAVARHRFDSTKLGIPEGVRDVVGRRLSRLSDDANATLRTAAVVGRGVLSRVVAEVVEVSEERCARARRVGDRGAPRRRVGRSRGG